ncbi:hypothetical protein [Phormidium sp. CCY1219]|uniref:hypothetical protein n=1 Tax=Phormidium sp. CCY1219 TaxID=2886104 RepID=UPI002D1EBBE2|nr:hypothetical protein [Phormidium sp. CCY1219]MEB3827609.1 hypothetical protein [Phormidium sp. CCY1219]
MTDNPVKTTNGIFLEELPADPALRPALQVVRERLQAFAGDPNFGGWMQLAFGQGIEIADLQDTWASGKLDSLPEIEVRPAAEINGAHGAFAAATNTIYLTQELLNESVAQVAQVFLEEYGHYLDSVLTPGDAPGDEGKLFSKLALGQEVSKSELTRLKEVDDTIISKVNGKTLALETFLHDTVDDAVDDAVDTGTDIVDDAVDTGTDIVDDAVDTGTDAVDDAVDIGGDIVDDAVDTGGDIVDDTIDTGSDIVNDTINTGSSIVDDAIDTGGDIVDDAIDTGSDIIGGGVDIGSDIIGGAFDLLESLSDPVKDALNGLATAISDAETLISNLDIPDFFFGNEVGVGGTAAFFSVGGNIKTINDTDIRGVLDIFPDILAEGSLSIGVSVPLDFSASIEGKKVAGNGTVEEALLADDGDGGFMRDGLSIPSGVSLSGSVKALGEVSLNASGTTTPSVGAGAGIGTGATFPTGIGPEGSIFSKALSKTVDTGFKAITIPVSSTLPISAPYIPVPESLLDDALDFAEGSYTAITSSLSDLEDTLTELGSEGIQAITGAIEFGTDVFSNLDNIADDVFANPNQVIAQIAEEVPDIDDFSFNPEDFLSSAQEATKDLGEALLPDVDFSLSDIEDFTLPDELNNGLSGELIEEVASLADSETSENAIETIEDSISLLQNGVDNIADSLNLSAADINNLNLGTLVPEPIQELVDGFIQELPDGILADGDFSFSDLLNNPEEFTDLIPEELPDSFQDFAEELAPDPLLTSFNEAFEEFFNPTVSVSAINAVKEEGDSGTTPFTFEVTRTGNTTEELTVDYTVSGAILTAVVDGRLSANADDFGGMFPSGTVTFAPGESSKNVTVNVTGDRTPEIEQHGPTQNRDIFQFRLSNPSDNATIEQRFATGEILNDDNQSSSTSVVEAVAQLDNSTDENTIQLGELQQAIDLWSNGEPVPGTNKTIGLDKLQEMVRLWKNAQPVTDADGFIANGTVFLDANQDRTLNQNEISTTTGSDGSFSFPSSEIQSFDSNGNGELDPSEGTLVLDSGAETTALATGLPFQLSLTAPASATVITPLTTLVSSLMERGQNLSEAENTVKTTFGLDEEIDLLNFAPIREANQGNSLASAVFASGESVQNAVTQIADFLQSASSASLAELGNAVFDAMSQQLNNSDFDLSAQSSLETLINQAAASAGISLSSEQSNVVDDVASIIAALQEQIDDLEPSNPQTFLTQVTKIQKVSQSNVADRLQSLGENPGTAETVVNNNTDENLATQIANAELENLFPPNVESISLSADRNLAEGDAIATVPASDADGDSLTFSIFSGNPDVDGDGTPGIAIDNTGELTVADRDDINGANVRLGVLATDSVLEDIAPVSINFGEEAIASPSQLFIPPLDAATDTTDTESTDSESTLPTLTDPDIPELTVPVTRAASEELPPENLPFPNPHSVARTMNGTQESDRLLGTPVAEAINGFAGSDMLLGSGENDHLIGNVGNDVLHGNSGHDFLDGGIGDDTLHAGQDNDAVVGAEGRDRIFGNKARDIAFGGPGNDFLNGNQGDDTVEGGDGDDVIHGGKDRDLLNGNLGADEVSGDDGDDNIFGEQGNDFVNGNRGSDILNGGEGDDVIRGGKADDFLFGTAGEDWLFGEMGDDLLAGGADRDRFVLQEDMGTDVITDFADGVDLIGLAEGLTFDQLAIHRTSGSTTVISMGDEVLATLNGVDASLIAQDDFFTVG